MGCGLTNTVVRAAWADPDGTLFAGTVGGGIFRLPHGGSSWEPYGLTELVITSIIRGGDGALYAGTYGGGVFQRSGPESEWREIFQGLTNPYVVSVEWVTNVRGGDALLAGTDGDGVFLLPILASDLDAEPRIAGIDNTLVLESNYPNPFSQSTTLSFSIPRTGNVNLRIFDVIGREVAEVLSGGLPPGRHTVRWEPSGLAGGTYIYTLSADREHRSGILTLAR